jgi:hypothetical protein
LSQCVCTVPMLKAIFGQKFCILLCCSIRIRQPLPHSAITVATFDLSSLCVAGTRLSLRIPYNGRGNKQDDSKKLRTSCYVFLLILSNRCSYILCVVYIFLSTFKKNLTCDVITLSSHCIITSKAVLAVNKKKEMYFPWRFSRTQPTNCMTFQALSNLVRQSLSKGVWFHSGWFPLVG